MLWKWHTNFQQADQYYKQFNDSQRMTVTIFDHPLQIYNILKDGTYITPSDRLFPILVFFLDNSLNENLMSINSIAVEQSRR